jgi:hypothetical protein
VVLAARDAGDTVTVDTGIYARTEFSTGTAVAIDSYVYPADMLRLIAELSTRLEFTVTTVAPG